MNSLSFNNILFFLRAIPRIPLLISTLVPLLISSSQMRGWQLSLSLLTFVVAVAPKEVLGLGLTLVPLDPFA